jgi:hypothetical protein
MVVMCPAGMFFSQHDWQSAIKLLEELAAAHAHTSTSSSPAAAARARTLASQTDTMLLRLHSKDAAPLTPTAWKKLVVQKQVWC